MYCAINWIAGTVVNKWTIQSAVWSTDIYKQYDGWIKWVDVYFKIKCIKTIE